MESTLCSTLSSQEASVNLYFIKPAHDTPSDVLLCAYQACEEFNTRWLFEEDYMEVTPTKEDVFICDPFEGKIFEYLISCPKSIVVGPRCILSCLYRKEPIPPLPSPLHNTAMNGLVITATGIPKNQKEELQHLIQRMSGIYSNNYHQDVTHLVVGMVGSKKYMIAVEQGIPTVTESWVRGVWEAVMNGEVSGHVSATDQQFLVPYLCKPFHGLVVCVSQADSSNKMALKKLIEDNGGTCTFTLSKGEASILVLSSPEGKKYQYALKWGVPCVYPEWLHNSVQQGHALDKEEFEVESRKASTLCNTHLSNEMLPDVSLCSTILNESEAQRSVLCVDETMNSLPVNSAKGGATLEESNKYQQDLEALEDLDLQEAMRAGNFLKGYRLFVTGFNSTHMEKLRRVLGAVGASRVSQLTEAVTHVVLARPNDEHLRIMQGWDTKPHVVSVRWITESVHLKSPAEESQFSYSVEIERDVEPQHPQTSNSYSRSQMSSSLCVSITDNDVTHVDEQSLEKHVMESKKMESDHDLSLLPESQASELPGIFSGKTFIVSGHSQETKDELEEMIELHGGQVVSANTSKPVHYSVVITDVLHHPRKGQLVSHAFVEECIESKRLVAVEYYHLPLLLPQKSFPLQGCCITVSIYADNERFFLVRLITLLGAQNQDNFSKSTKTTKAHKKILANTHLLCPTPAGAKYDAAKKWGIPAVTCDWLIECARTGKKVPEEPFMLESHSDNTKKLPRKTIIRELWDSAIGIKEKSEVAEEAEDEDVPPTPAVKKTKPFISKEIVDSLSPERPPIDREAFSRMYPTPGTIRYYQAKRQEELDAMPTPDTPYGLTWYSNPPPDVKKCIKKLIDSLPDVPPPPSAPAAKSPTEELWKDFFDTLHSDLEKAKERHRQLLEEVLQSGKVHDKENKGSENKGKLSTTRDKSLEKECINDLDKKEFNTDYENEVESGSGVQLSHQLKELARASLVERNAGSTGRSKVPLGDIQKPTTPSKIQRIDLESQANEEVEPQSTQITWDDPEEHMARLSLKEQMEKETQDFSAPVQKEEEAMNINDDDDNSNNNPSAPLDSTPLSKEKTNEKTSTVTISSGIQEKPVFVFVGMSDESVQHYTELVVQLGGKVSLSRTLEPQVTHVIAKTLSRSERTLISIVSGRWLLMELYLEHSIKAGHFIEEEQYAWGNISSKYHQTLKTDSMQAKLAAAAWRWKCARSPKLGGQKQQKAFQNMTALIHAKKELMKGITRLIEAGGGKVISSRPPYSKVEGITHFFVEMEKPHEKIDLASFASRGIPCLLPAFISQCITEDSPNISEFYIPAYKEIMLNMSTVIPSPLRRAQRN